MSSGPREPGGLLCPSAQPDWEDAFAIGVVGGTPEAPQVGYLERPLPVSDELLALAEPALPTEVFRFAAGCVNDACRHNREGSCRLAAKVVAMLEPVTQRLPPCTIRGRCRWFQQEGREACRRCPQVVTDNIFPTPQMRAAADPEVVLA